MKIKLTRIMLGMLLGSAILVQAGTAQASNFTFPQGVYNGEQVELSSLPNGGVVNASMLDRIKQTQPTEPYTVEITDGIWALVGYHWGYKAVIEGEKGLILYDTGDDIEEAQDIIELIKKISKKPIRTVIYSHAHYAFGTKAIADKYGDDITIIGNSNLNKNILESGGLGSAIPELAPSLLARTLEQFSFLLPESGPDAKAPTPVGKTKGFIPIRPSCICLKPGRC